MVQQISPAITATHIVYYLVCPRKLWLFAHQVEMEHFSDLVLEGRLIHDTTYQRRPSQYVEIALDGVKIDFFDPQERVVHEVKRGRSMENIHRIQVQYYLYKLQQYGVYGASGLIEYPDLRRTEKVEALTERDITQLQQWELEVQNLMHTEHCPPLAHKPICKHCSYFDLCYVGEA